MTWFKVDDGLHKHRKRIRAGVEAMGLWVIAGSWCADELTDGWVPADVVDYLAPGVGRDLAKRLETARLWIADTRDGEEGWQFHEWTDQQPTRDEVTAQREKKADGGKVGNHRRWHVSKGVVDPRCAYCRIPESGPTRTPDPTSDPTSDPSTDQTSDRYTDRSTDQSSESGASRVRIPPTRPDPTRPDPTRPDQEVQTPMANAARRPPVQEALIPGTEAAVAGVDALHADSMQRASRDRHFVEFWSAYPRKIGKQGARKTWDAAVKRGVAPAAVTAGAVAFAEHVRAWRTPEDKIPHPSTWLNAGRWEDDLPPAPSQALEPATSATGMGAGQPRGTDAKVGRHLSLAAKLRGGSDA